MKYIIWIFFTVSIWSCQNKVNPKELKGDLYFGLFRIGSYYDQPDSIIQWYESYFDTTNFKLEDKNEQQLFSTYQNLKRHNLLYNPFVELLVQSDSIVKLYLDVSDYDRIKTHRRQVLQNDNKKVIIKSEVELIENGIYNCVELKSVQVVDGQTLQLQKKFKIEDYN